MIYKKLENGGEIHIWFPKSIYYNNFFSSSQLKKIQKNIKSLNYNKQRTFEFEVDTSFTSNYSSLHKESALSEVFNTILNSAKEYGKELGYNNDYCNRLTITDSWFNISNKGDYLQKHIHPNSLFSGAFYVKCDDEDYIRFYEDNMFFTPHNLNELSYTNTSYKCEPGTLLIFKSNLSHSTNKQKSKEKIVISFNINVN